VLELAVAGAALTVHDEIAALAVAALFLAFTVFVVSALARGLPIESCGCFGRTDTRPSASHVAVDAALAAAALLVAVDDVEPVRALLADDVARGCGVLAVALVIAVLVTVWWRGSFTSSGNRATRSYRALR
jgi:hypothetical protein